MHHADHSTRSTLHAAIPFRRNHVLGMTLRVWRAEICAQGNLSHPSGRMHRQAGTGIRQPSPDHRVHAAYPCAPEPGPSLHPRRPRPEIPVTAGSPAAG